MVTREKEKEKRILKKKIQELQEQLIEIEKKSCFKIPKKENYYFKLTFILPLNTIIR